MKHNHLFTRSLETLTMAALCLPVVFSSSAEASTLCVRPDSTSTADLNLFVRLGRLVPIGTVIGTGTTQCLVNNGDGFFFVAQDQISKHFFSFVNGDGSVTDQGTATGYYEVERSLAGAELIYRRKYLYEIEGCDESCRERSPASSDGIPELGLRGHGELLNSAPVSEDQHLNYAPDGEVGGKPQITIMLANTPAPGLYENIYIDDAVYPTFFLPPGLYKATKYDKWGRLWLTTLQTDADRAVGATTQKSRLPQ